MAETPFDVVLSAYNGFLLSSCLYAVAQAGIADALGGTPKTGRDLATATGTHAGALGRILRVLCSVGIFETRDGSYVHTSASRLLQKNHPQSVRGYVMALMPIFWEPFGRLSYSLSTGKPAFEETYPGGIFKYFAEHPEKARIFDDAMTGKAQAQIAGAVTNYDFSRFGTIADIGGGRGHLLASIQWKELSQQFADGFRTQFGETEGYARDVYSGVRTKPSIS